MLATGLRVPKGSPSPGKVGDIGQLEINPISSSLTVASTSLPGAGTQAAERIRDRTIAAAASMGTDANVVTHRQAGWKTAPLRQ